MKAMMAHGLRRTAASTGVVAAIVLGLGAAAVAGGARERVLVKIEVPGLAALTAASTAQPGIRPGQARYEPAADQALARAIEGAARELAARLDSRDVPYAMLKVFRTVPYVLLDVDREAKYLIAADPMVRSVLRDEPVPLIDAVEKGDTIEWDATREPAPARLDNTVHIIGADAVWAAGNIGTGWWVAILDTGIRSSHQMFAGKSIVEACFALGADGAAGAGDCPNGQSSMTGTGSAAHHPSSYEGYDHGTHVAGIAAGNNGAGLTGVARGANVIAVNVFTKFGPADCGSPEPCVLTWISDQISGLEYIYSIRGSYAIGAINMSLGGGKYTSQAQCDVDDASNAVKAPVDLLRAAGIATIVASGNNGFCDGISSPGCISSVVAVGASTDGDDRANFSNHLGSLLEVFAPGVDILSSTGGSDTSYEGWNGTSMATPHVTGAWTLLREVSSSTHRAATVSELLNAVLSTGTSLLVWSCDGQTKPRIQVDAAADEVRPEVVPGLAAAGAGLLAILLGRWLRRRRR
ncbi:MAG: S8 family serine peptidase [Candidatus Schekmanbacteria bacterium]|nr:S8 family serine peptidase [Candidatus Schekmanbacteria bacterium]